MLLSVLIYAYSHGVRSSRAIERLCGRDAGYRFIVGEHVPDHTVIARFRRRHVERLEAVFVRVLEMCRDAGLIRLGLVVLDGTKVKANASLEANRSAATIDEQVARMVAEAESTDRREDRLFGPRAMQFWHGGLILFAGGWVAPVRGDGSMEATFQLRGGRPGAVWLPACRTRRGAGSAPRTRAALQHAPSAAVFGSRCADGCHLL